MAAFAPIDHVLHAKLKKKVHHKALVVCFAQQCSFLASASITVDFHPPQSICSYSGSQWPCCCACMCLVVEAVPALPLVTSLPVHVYSKGIVSIDTEIAATAANIAEEDLEIYVKDSITYMDIVQLG